MRHFLLTILGAALAITGVHAGLGTPVVKTAGTGSLMDAACGLGYSALRGPDTDQKEIYILLDQRWIDVWNARHPVSARYIGFLPWVQRELNYRCFGKPDSYRMLNANGTDPWYIDEQHDMRNFSIGMIGNMNLRGTLAKNCLSLFMQSEFGVEKPACAKDERLEGPGFGDGIPHIYAPGHWNRWTS